MGDLAMWNILAAITAGATVFIMLTSVLVICLYFYERYDQKG
jgi:hypothetical protein